jgi:LysR family glycine cleavage system transcriptional activator
MRGRLPPLSALRAFEAAARHSSFKRAAAELGVTPTAISHHIRLLEADIGKDLFLRQARAVTLTADDDKLFGPLSEAFRSMVEAVASVKRRPDRDVATLSATSAFTARLLVPHASAFRDLNPGWALRLLASDEPVNLEAGEADAAVRYGGEHSPGLMALPLISDQYAPVCSPKLDLRSAEDLAKVALIHFDWRYATNKRTLPTWRLWAVLAGMKSLDPDSGIALNDESAAIQAAVEVQGVSLASLTLVETELASGALVQPFGPSIDGRRYDFVFPAHAETRPAVVALRRWLVESLALATRADRV